MNGRSFGRSLSRSLSGYRRLAQMRLSAFNHALELYRRLVALRVRAQLEYRVSFLLDTFANLVSTLVGFVTLALVMQRFDGVGGWSIAEVALLFGLVEFSFGIMDMLFSGFDPSYFGQQVRLGAFDQILLRPVSVVLQVLTLDFVLRRLGRILQGGAVLIIGLYLCQIEWTAGKLLYLPVVVLSQVAFFGGISVIGAAVTFWTVDSIEFINIFTYGGAEMLSYPMHIYPTWMIRFFTYIVPAIFINYYPALYLLGRTDPLGAPAWAMSMAPAAGAFMLTAAALAWRIGTRHYTSTGT